MKSSYVFKVYFRKIEIKKLFVMIYEIIVYS